jgi:hypothetical protein
MSGTVKTTFHEKITATPSKPNRRKIIMYTRRSPRNQSILWKALAPPTPKITPAAVVERCWDCKFYPKGGRSTGSCFILERTVSGITPAPACFVKR